jgi:hypothetical protein
LRRKDLVVALFPAILFLWMLGWCLYSVGKSRQVNRGRRVDESYWIWHRRQEKMIVLGESRETRKK